MRLETTCHHLAVMLLVLILKGAVTEILVRRKFWSGGPKFLENWSAGPLFSENFGPRVNYGPSENTLV